MNRYTLVAGIDGTGKSSLRGVLEGQGEYLGHIIDPDLIARENHFDSIRAGKQAILEINDCLQKNLSFTQETTLSGKRIEKTLIQARKQGYFVSLFYVGLNTHEESLSRIENRVRKGGHPIPPEDVKRRFSLRFSSLARILPYCDQVAFYDNENGFLKVAHIQNHRFSFLNGYRPPWILELQQTLSL